MTSNFGHFTFQIFHRNKENGNIAFTQFSPNLISEIITKFSPLLLVKTYDSIYTCIFGNTCTFSRAPFPNKYCIEGRECKMYSPGMVIMMPVQMFEISSACGIQCCGHKYYSPKIMMMMLLVQSCQTFVTCEKHQTGMTGEETPPLCFPHQRRQYIDADNNDDNHLFHSKAHKCPKFGNHQNSDVPRKYFPITKYQFPFFNYVFSITYYLFPNTNYLFAKIKTIDTTIPYLGTKIPRYEDTVSWCTKTKKNTKSTKSKIQMQEPSQKPFVKTFSTPSNSYQSNPIQSKSLQVNQLLQ